jgi:glycopeptide antibiotics resistance protein
LTSLTFEALQLITHIGCFSAIDLVTNTLGAMIGYFIYRIIYRNESKRLVMLCIASAIMVLAIIPLVYSAVARTVDMRDLYIDVLLRRL